MVKVVYITIQTSNSTGWPRSVTVSTLKSDQSILTFFQVTFEMIFSYKLLQQDFFFPFHNIHQIFRLSQQTMFQDFYIHPEVILYVDLHDTSPKFFTILQLMAPVLPNSEKNSYTATFMHSIYCTYTIHYFQVGTVQRSCLDLE